MIMRPQNTLIIWFLLAAVSVVWGTDAVDEDPKRQAWGQEWFTKSGVTVYGDGQDSLFGRSPRRQVMITILDEIYSTTSSLDVSQVLSGEEYYETALLLDEAVRNELLLLFQKGNEVVLSSGYRLSWTQEGPRKVFSLTHEGTGLDVAFSLSRPSEEILAVVREVYSQDALWQRWRQPVLEHYRLGYVVAVHRAENILEPWNQEITYEEALLAATLLADREQWLWGIHDGRGLLEEIVSSAGKQGLP